MSLESMLSATVKLEPVYDHVPRPHLTVAVYSKVCQHKMLKQFNKLCVSSKTKQEKASALSF
jgi:hypothetical protein